MYIAVIIEKMVKIYACACKGDATSRLGIVNRAANSGGCWACLGATFFALKLHIIGGDLTILKNMSSSMGRIITYMTWKKTNV